MDTRRPNAAPLRSSLVTGLCLTAFAALAISGPLAARDWPAHFTACDVPGLPDEARCTTVDVLENPGAPEGRTVSLWVAVVPAEAAAPASDPLFAIEGGPGGAISGSAASYVQLFQGVRASRDLVLVDRRGTGRSGALPCDAPPGSQLIDAEGAAACAAALAERADLRFYTVPYAMDDLDAVRNHLGYATINLFGISYGSREALVYLRQHRERVRSVVLMAPYPLERNVPRNAGRIVEDALQGTIDACLDNPACASAFPELRADLETLGARFGKEGTIHWNGQAIEHASFASTLRMMLFFPPTASRVPLVVHRAARGDFAPFVFDRMRLTGTLGNWISLGTFLSVLCTEDIAGLDPADVTTRADGTFLGTSWTDTLIATCAAWPPGTLPENYHEPVALDVPVLLLTGENDPSMPSSWAVAMGEAAPATTVVIPEGSHNFIGMTGAACLVDLMTRFVERGTALELDTSCARAMKRPPFAVP